MSIQAPSNVEQPPARQQRFVDVSRDPVAKPPRRFPERMVRFQKDDDATEGPNPQADSEQQQPAQPDPEIDPKYRFIVLSIQHVATTGIDYANIRDLKTEATKLLKAGESIEDFVVTKIDLKNHRVTLTDRKRKTSVTVIEKGH